MLFIDADTRFCVNGLSYSTGAGWINDATISASVMDQEFTVLASFPLDYVANSDGDYEGICTAAMSGNLEPNEEYIVEITATKDAYTDKRRELHYASYRGF